jgi:hypothetical protein
MHGGNLKLIWLTFNNPKEDPTETHHMRGDPKIPEIVIKN